MAKHKVAYAASAAALALSGVVIPTNVLADDAAINWCAQATGAVAEGTTITLDGSAADSLGAAVKGATEDTTCTHKIEVLSNITDGGVELKGTDKADFVIELNGHTVTMGVDSLHGSTGTETQNWHIEKGSNYTVQNGKIVGSSDADILIQNYANMTLHNVEIDGSTLQSGATTVSSNNGIVNITGSTSISAATNGVALDAFWWDAYPDGTQITIDTTGAIGDFGLGYSTHANMSEIKTSVDIKNGVFTGVVDYYLYNQDSSPKAIENDSEKKMESQVTAEGGTFGTISSAWTKGGYVSYTTTNGTHKVITKDSFRVRIRDYSLVVGETANIKADISWTPEDYAGGCTFSIQDDADGAITLNDGVITAVKSSGEWPAIVRIKAEESTGYEYDVLVSVKDGIDSGWAGTRDENDNYYEAYVEFDNEVEGGKQVKLQMKEVTEALLEQDSKLKAIYDLSVVGEDGVTPIALGEGNKATVTLHTNSNVLGGKYNNFKIVYITDDGEVTDEEFETKVEIGTEEGSDVEYYTITFVTSHFSSFGLDADNVETPDTGFMTSSNAAGNVDMTALVATVIVMTLATAGMEIALWKKRQANK